MENKTNMILGLNAVIIVWLLFLTFKVFSGGVSSSDLAAARERANLDAAKVDANNVLASTTIDPNKPMPAVNPTNGQNTNAQQPPQPTIDPATATQMTFEEESFDFGVLQEGEKASHVFKFKNTGDKPLTISNARGSCGCTVPEWPKEPIPPGEEGEINVEFNSKGKKGNQTKYVTISANTIPAETKLTISSNVLGLETDEEKKEK